MNQNINHNKTRTIFQCKFILTRWEGLRLSVWLGKSSSVKDGCFNIPGSRSMLESLSWSETLLSSESAVTKRNVNFVLPSAKKKKTELIGFFFFFLKVSWLQTKLICPTKHTKANRYCHTNLNIYWGLDWEKVVQNRYCLRRSQKLLDIGYLNQSISIFLARVLLFTPLVCLFGICFWYSSLNKKKKSYFLFFPL